MRSPYPTCDLSRDGLQHTEVIAAQGLIRKGALHREKTPFTWVPLPGSAKEQSDVPSAGDNEPSLGAPVRIGASGDR